MTARSLLIHRRTRGHRPRLQFSRPYDGRGLYRDSLESRGPGHGPSGGHVQSGHVLPPSNRRKTDRRHNGEHTNELRRTEAESSNPGATSNEVRRRTNNRRPICIPVQVSPAQHKPLVVAEGDRFECRSRPEHRKPGARSKLSLRAMSS
jgi:hypothetical protein